MKLIKINLIYLIILFVSYTFAQNDIHSQSIYLTKKLQNFYAKYKSSLSGINIEKINISQKKLDTLNNLKMEIEALKKDIDSFIKKYANTTQARDFKEKLEWLSDIESNINNLINISSSNREIDVNRKKIKSLQEEQKKIEEKLKDCLRNNQSNTIRYIDGREKNLVNAGILELAGFWPFRVPRLSGNFLQKLQNSLDLNKGNEIIFNNSLNDLSEILPSRDPFSYELIEINETSFKLKIIDKNKFIEPGNYLVVIYD